MEYVVLVDFQLDQSLLQLHLLQVELLQYLFFKILEYIYEWKNNFFNMRYNFWNWISYFWYDQSIKSNWLFKYYI